MWPGIQFHRTNHVWCRFLVKTNPQCNEKMASMYIWKIMSNCFTEKVFCKTLISRNICSKKWVSVPQCGKMKKSSLTKKFFRQIDSLFSKNVTFTKFLRKMCEAKLQQFPHCGNYGNLLSLGKNFVKLTYLL